ncbi:MAG: hypothetical protein H0X45_10275 [Planctomycetes bacterium]|nr:hypothetical protein [Planctomycetota bacterium]
MAEAAVDREELLAFVSALKRFNDASKTELTTISRARSGHRDQTIRRH